jgi:general secretion pathway protein G
LSRPARLAFTLVELLVVIGIIALLVSILLPVLGKARAQAQTLKCMSNLRQMGLAMHMYAGAYKGYLPYPTTMWGGPTALWFNAVDPYLGALSGRPNATGVAADRSYKTYKQCVVWDTFEGDKFEGAQGDTKEFSKTFKMNSHLRRNNVTRRPPNSSTFVIGPARITDVKRSSEFVLMGDGISLDQTGPIPGQWENGQFSMEVNDITEATPALRHQNGANILFVDGHVETVRLPSVSKTLRAPQANIRVQTWESEFIDSAGRPVGPTNNMQERMTAEQLGYRRNPRMPLIWSNLGELYRP